MLQKLQRGLVGLSGESRPSDANQSFFHTSAAPLAPQVRPAPPTTFGERPPARRPDVPCETQEVPNLDSPAANVTPSGVLTPRPDGQKPTSAKPPAPVRAKAFIKAREIINDYFDRIERRRERAAAQGDDANLEEQR